MKVLWLCSWYPSLIDPFDGDFIQRHAYAAAMFNDVYVIHVAPDERGQTTNNVREEIRKKERLTECIVYFKKNTSLFGKAYGFLKWRGLFKKAITDYIRKNGKPEVVHVHVPMRAGLLALWLKRKHHIPYIVSEHWTIYQPGSTNGFRTRNPLFKLLTRRIVKKSSALITVSKDLGEKINGQVCHKNFLVIPNVADETLYYFQPDRPRPFVFIHVSNMSYQKNVPSIVKSFDTVHDEFPNSQLVLVGPLEETIVDLVKQTHLLERSIFLRGEIPYSEVANAVREANALVLFSHFENLPCVIIESLCCGRPVITTPVGGIQEIINERNGLFVNVNDDISLVSAMKKMMMDYSSFNLKDISEEARSNFSYPVVGKLFDKIYRDLSQKR
jgi:glycosyltransferase involved in cell wall biosynthesis